MRAAFRHSLLLAVMLGLIVSLAPTPLAAVVFDTFLEDAECEDRGTVMAGGQQLTVIECENVVVFSDWSVLPIDAGAIVLNISGVLFFYTPSLDWLRRINLETRQYGGGV